MGEVKKKGKGERVECDEKGERGCVNIERGCVKEVV